MPVMSMPRIRFLYFDDCPLAGRARERLEAALSDCGYPAGAYEAVDLLAPSTSHDLARWGSPTILVDGNDVAGHARGDGVGCRVYDTADRVPDVAAIRAAIHEATGRTTRGHFNSHAKASG